MSGNFLHIIFQRGGATPIAACLGPSRLDGACRDLPREVAAGTAKSFLTYHIPLLAPAEIRRWIADVGRKGDTLATVQKMVIVGTVAMHTSVASGVRAEVADARSV